MDLRSLEDTFIPDVLKDYTWVPLLIGSVDVHHILVREFFLNAIVEEDHLNCWVRRKEFTIFAMSIENFCKVEFIQPSNWLYSVPNLLVIQHLVTLYLGGFDVRVVSEIE